MRCLSLVLLVACGGSSPSPAPPSPAAPAKEVCETGIAKLGELLERKFQHALTGEERTKALDECRTTPAVKQLAECVTKATGDEAVVACMEEDRPKKRLGEPTEDLDRLVENMRIYHISHEVMVDGTQPLTPAQPCCQYPDGKCPAGSWGADTWTVLGLDNSKARLFQFRFEGTRSKAVIEAVGDLDCDGRTVVFRRELELRSDGNMHITVVDANLTDD